MHYITLSWVIVFLLFALSLLFVWSKVYIIAGKIRTIDALVGRCEAIDASHSAKKADNPSV